MSETTTAAPAAPKTRSRYDDALYAQAGACNPVALANSLAERLKEAMDEGHGTMSARLDPACQLITHQLAFLMGLEFGWRGDGYAEAMRAVVAKADPAVAKSCGFDSYLPKPAP
jgi:hypothetical protein